MRPKACCRAARVLCCVLPFLLAVAATAQWRAQPPRPFDERVRTDPRLLPNDAVEPLTGGAAGVEAKAARAWDLFRLGETGEWQAYLNRSNGRVEMIEGAGIPWLPGAGNPLVRADLAGLWDVPLAEDEEIRLSTLERIARAFLPRVQALLGVDPAALVLNRGRSGQPADGVWFVDFDVVEQGLPIDGARVLFRVNHGNLVQFGSEGLPTAGAVSPRPTLSRERALAVVAKATGVVDGELLDGGALHLLTLQEGKGRGLIAAWQFAFRRAGVTGTWRARVDAATGDLLELADVNAYGKVRGGVYLHDPADGPEVERPLPDVTLSGAAASCANASGSFPGTAGSASLNGCFIKITDICGGTAQAADASGLIDFGTSAGTDCTTPGHGGAGNTHAARTQSYHLSRLREVARSWLPTNTWLTSLLTVDVNLNQTCNAYWNGTSLNFFKSGGGCGNSGELASISFHEYGHGFDQNDGTGTSPDGASGESYGDFTSALELHNSCVETETGSLGTNCSGYGDPCTACTGQRDIDWGNHVSGLPHTVANFVQLHCPAGFAGDIGPCGKMGHCESYIPSEALWDFVNRDLPGAGSPGAWLIIDRLWYLTRNTATQSFSCTPGATYTSNGCNVGSLWKTFRAIDDDDGNLANGTPHSCALFAAFNRHGIACTTDPGASICFNGCPTTPGTPTLTATPGTLDQVQLAWSNLGAGVTYDVFASIAGCRSAFTKIANNFTGTSFTDTGAGNGVARAYQVIAHTSGNASCAGPATACTEITACTTTSLLHQAFGTGAAGWTLGPDWHDQTCSSSGVLHFGGTTCTTNYANNRSSLGASPAIAVPVGTLGAKLTLIHRYQFETGFDGGALRFSLDAGSPVFLPASTIVSGATYNGTLNAACPPAGTAGAAVFTGTQSTFVTTVVDLDAACSLASGGTLTSCGGHTIQIDFAGISDCITTSLGWFLDDVAVTACVP
jgi:hypothetical protein